MRRDFCVTCYKKIFNHSSHAVRDEMVRVAMNTTTGKNAASEIIKGIPLCRLWESELHRLLVDYFFQVFNSTFKTFLAEQK